MRFSIFLSYLVYLLYNSISIAYLVNLKTFKAANRLINLDSEVRQLTLSASSKDETTDGPIFNDILEQQFLELTVGQENEDIMEWKKFFAWEEVQALLSEKVCDKKDIEDMWSGVAGSLDASIDYDKFVVISEKLDSLFEVMDNDIDEIPYSEALIESIEYQNTIPEGNVWSVDFQASKALEPEFLAYLTSFFKEKTEGKGKGTISYDTFASWKDVQSMLQEGEVDETCLKDLWAEACIKQSSLENAELSKEIGLDSFIRLNVRLDQTLDEIAEALDTLNDDDIADYYKGVFESITGAVDGYMTRGELRSWADEELKGIISESQLEALWEALPKKSDKIDVASFLAFNTAVEDIEESEFM